MTSAALVAKPRVSVPQCYSPTRYLVQGEHSLSGVTDSYAEQLHRILSNTAIGDKFQLKLNTTVGQFFISFPTEFGFHVGKPSISPAWPISSESWPKWTAGVFQLCASGQEDAALKEIALATARFKDNQQFAKLSTDLETLDLGKLPDIVLVAMLRSTFSIRSRVSCWNVLLAQIEQILQERGREPRTLLRGLKRYS